MRLSSDPLPRPEAVVGHVAQCQTVSESSSVNGRVLSLYNETAHGSDIMTQIARPIHFAVALPPESDGGATPGTVRGFRSKASAYSVSLLVLSRSVCRMYVKSQGVNRDRE